MAATRYPGVTSFQDTALARRLFFGRDEESKRLFYYSAGDALTVLYSKSGYGKTSLLQARVFGMLREQNSYPVFIRFNKRGYSPNEIIKAEVANSKLEGYEIIAEQEQQKLKDFFHNLEIWSPENKLQTPVIVLDQFEEIFTLEHNFPYWTSFFEELANVLNEVKEGRIQVKFIISIREDFLGYLEKMANAIPSIFSNRFRLEALSKNDAQEAIEQPGRIKVEGVEFSSPKIVFAPDAMAALKSFLSLRMIEGKWMETSEVEPIQMQIICSELEERAIEAKQKANIASYTVTKDDLKGEEGLKELLGTFYSKQLEKVQRERNLTKEELLAVRNLIEKELIVGNRRIPKDYDAIVKYNHIPQPTLDLLIKTKLLKVEKYQQNSLVELSHDTLVEPIMKAYEKRRLEEEAAIEKKKQQEELERRQRKRKIRTAVAIASSILLLLSIGALLLLSNAKKENKRIKQQQYISTVISTEKFNPTLAYLIAMDGYAIDPASGILDDLLKSFDTANNYYMQTMIMLPDKVTAASFSGENLIINTFTNFYRYTLEGRVKGTMSFGDLYYLNSAVNAGGKNILLLNDLGNKTIRLCDENNQVICSFPYYNSSPLVSAISPDGTSFLIDSVLYAINTDPSKGPGIIASFKDWSNYGAPLDVKFSNDGKYIISYHSDFVILIHDLQGRTKQIIHDPTSLIHEPNSLTSVVSLTSDLKYLVAIPSSSDYSKRILIWDLESISPNESEKILNNQNEQVELKGHLASINCFAISPDNKYIVTGGNDNLAFVWDFKGNVISVLSGHTGKINFVRFADNYKTIVTGAENGEVIVWNFDKPSELYKQHKLARFSPYDYYAIGLKDYNVQKIYKQTSNIDSLYFSVLNYTNHLPKVNLFPGDNTYAQMLKSSVGELNSLYKVLLNHPQLAQSVTKSERILLYKSYASFINNIPELLQTIKYSVAAMKEVEAQSLIWLKKALLVDTSDFNSGFQMIGKYYDVSDFFSDSLKYAKASAYIDSAKALGDAFLSKYPDSTSLLALVCDVYSFSSVIKSRSQNAGGALADANKAIALAQKNIALNNSDITAKIALIKAYLLANKYEDAYQQYTSANKLPDFKFLSVKLKSDLDEINSKDQPNETITKFMKNL